eukprot:6521182-Prymnesium_polylepis.2
MPRRAALVPRAAARRPPRARRPAVRAGPAARHARAPVGRRAPPPAALAARRDARARRRVRRRRARRLDPRVGVPGDGDRGPHARRGLRQGIAAGPGDAAVARGDTADAQRRDARCGPSAIALRSKRRPTSVCRRKLHCMRRDSCGHRRVPAALGVTHRS